MPPRPSSPLVAGLDLGGTKLLGLVLDPEVEEASPLAEGRVPTPEGADAVLAALADLVTDLRDRARSDHGRELRAVGLGAPGLVDRAGTFRYGPNLPGVVGVPVAAELSERVGLPVVVDNDATCAAWGEHERGASRGRNHSLLVTLGTGIGGGITVKGEVLRGAYGFAGEPGHMVVDPSGPPCTCGRSGCWERYASGTGLGWLARDSLERGDAPADGPMVEAAGGEVSAVRGEHVAAAARDGDPAARAVFDRLAGWLALGLANLISVLDCEIVVVGGGLVEIADLFLPQTRRELRTVLIASEHRPRVPLVPARLGERAGAIGAALLATART